MRGIHPSSVEAPVRRDPPWAMTAIGVFLFFGAVMASLAGTTLIWPGTFLDHMWVLNAPAYKQLAPFGKTVGVPFVVLSAALAAAGVGWFGRRLWGMAACRGHHRKASVRRFRQYFYGSFRQADYSVRCFQVTVTRMRLSKECLETDDLKISGFPNRRFGQSF